MNIIDILILAVLGVSVIFGMHRGFISGVLSVAALVGAALMAFAVSPQLANWLGANETLVNTLIYYTDAGSRIGDLELSMLSVGQVTQGVLSSILQSAGMPAAFEAAFINALPDTAAGTTVSALLSQTIVKVSLAILSFLICFLLCYLIALFVIHLINYVFELPVLRHLDALIGGVFGFARGYMLLLILFALVPIVLAVAPIEQIEQLYSQSQLAPYFDSQLILTIIGLN